MFPLSSGWYSFSRSPQSISIFALIAIFKLLLLSFCSTPNLNMVQMKLSVAFILAGFSIALAPVISLPVPSGSGQGNYWWVLVYMSNVSDISWILMISLLLGILVTVPVLVLVALAKPPILPLAIIQVVRIQIRKYIFNDLSQILMISRLGSHMP